ncbi:MAG: methyltransferase domain-containing protein [Nitrospirota bacterium]|jgi:radical SAM protein with 4Fe4S-binding SPASM domain
MKLEGQTPLHAPAMVVAETRGDTVILIDPDGPNWIATDGRGARLLQGLNGGTPLREVVRDYGAREGVDPVKAWQHVDTLVRDALRHGFLTTGPMVRSRYAGREVHLAAVGLQELWLHTNNSCNLACRHCLVSSGPDGDRGLPTAAFLDVIAQGRALGVRRFYFTGGEPLIRPDIVDLCQAALADPEAEVAILTNGIPLRGERLAGLAALDRQRLRVQVSLDGSCREINDPLRGDGSFDSIIEGIRLAVGTGLQVTVTTAIAAANAGDVPAVTRLCGELGVRHHHLLWLHKRGRAANGLDSTPTVEEVIAVVRAAIAAGRECGVTVDNPEAVKARLNGPAGMKRDLSNACVTSLSVYADGSVYPSASTAGVAALRCGSILDAPLEEIWRESPVAQEWRRATVEAKEICRSCSLRYLCGGGDVEHAYFYGGSILAHDPYCALHQAMIGDALFERAAERAAVHTNGRSGFDAPVLFTAMGEGAVHCASHEVDAPVTFSHSECVVSFDLDAPRAKVREFYGEAAEEPQADLCCPVQPEAADIAHIPREVVERFYGCGSPVGAAAIRPGEVTLDLGSGAGIDVFTAAKKVGPSGKAIGVDMTDEMLTVARECQPKVAANLGFDVVEFRKGFLEAIPVEDATVDLVTSNCVVNLSPDKKRVFAEIWRVLRDHGRMVISDIVSEEQVPAAQRQDPRLWGECISGALTEEELLAYLERAGFYGVELLAKSFWKEVEGYRFHSVTVRGYRFEKKAGCVYLGQTATYIGPFKGVSDEEGHFFPRGVATEVCTDTAAKLCHPPYLGHFVVTDPGGTTAAGAGNTCCGPGGGCC